MAGSSPAGGPQREGNGKKTQEIKVRLPEQVAPGAYANTMMVQHSREEFVMDFIMAAAGVGTVVSRVVTSPGHMKRIIAALEDNIRRYEAAYGPVKGEEGQPPMIFGFPPSTGGEN